MISVKRPLRSLGSLVCLAILTIACRPLSSGTEEPLLSTNEVTSGRLSVTPDGPTDTPLATTVPSLRSTDSTIEAPWASEGEGSSQATGEVPEDLLEAILADAADRSGLPREAFAVLWEEAVTWRDGSLGCPQPGAEYAQVLTPGFRVMLEAGGQIYEYHTGPAGWMALCEVQEPLQKPGPEPSRRPPILEEEMVTTPVGKDLKTVIDVAKQDLARRLEVAPVEIEVLQIESAEWPDTSLGCGEPGLARLPVAIAGYRLVLLAKDREYVYHTGRESGVVYCPKG